MTAYQCTATTLHGKKGISPSFTRQTSFVGFGADQSSLARAACRAALTVRNRCKIEGRGTGSLAREPAPPE